MDYKAIAAALEELRIATDRLFPSEDPLDLDDLESAVAKRQAAVQHLSALAESESHRFTETDLDRLRTYHRKGKCALEVVLEARRSGWRKSTDMTRDSHILRSFARP